MGNSNYNRQQPLPEGSTPVGLVVIGGYLFVIDANTKKGLAHKIDDRRNLPKPLAREAEKDIDVFDAAGNDDLGPAVLIGNTLYVYDRKDEKLYNYTVSFDSEGAYSSIRRGVASKDVSKAKFHGVQPSPRYPIDFLKIPNEDTVLVGDPYERNLFAYDARTWLRNPEKDWRGIDRFKTEHRVSMVIGGLTYKDRSSRDREDKRVYINNLMGNNHRISSFNYSRRDTSVSGGFSTNYERPDPPADNLHCGIMEVCNNYFFITRPTYIFIAN